MSEIVVIGAGVGGLAAAIRLAAAGHRVTVHERAAEVGGKLAVYERDGYRFDTGPSLLTLPQVFEEMDLGLKPEPLDPVAPHRPGRRAVPPGPVAPVSARGPSPRRPAAG